MADAIDGAATIARLEAAIAAGRPASILISSASGNSDPVLTKKLVALAQSHGIAALVDGSYDLVISSGADGLHIGWGENLASTYAAARAALGVDRIIGVDAGRSRHNAMELGEAGADYIAFGIPTHVQDRDKARERRIELIEWWSELFEIPCVAFDVDDAVDAHALSLAGADFVSLRLTGTISPADARDQLLQFAAALGSIEPAET